MMTPERVLTVVELALYRVSDRMKRAPQKRPVSADAVAVALRWVGEEIASIIREEQRPTPVAFIEAKKERDAGWPGNSDS